MEYYLYVNENRHARTRTNGLQFHGYPNRNGHVDPDVIVIHTAENIPDLIPPDHGAENVAAYFSVTSRPASAHTVLDADSLIRLLPDEAVAFHVIGYNTRGWGLEIATQARKWSALPDDYAAVLLNAAAKETARVATKYGIPVAFRTKPQIDQGLPGITGHTDLDPNRRSDPGFTEQQWFEFLNLVRFHQKDGNMTHEHLVDPATLPRKWADAVWDRYVLAGGTTNPDTRSWEMYREDLAWFWDKFIAPLQANYDETLERLVDVEERVHQLEQAQPVGSLPIDVRISEIP